MIMGSRKQELGTDGADQSQEHVPLGIPDVALRTQEGLCGLTPQQHRRPPLDHLVEGTERQAHADDEEEEPLPGLEWRLPEQDLSSQNHRNEASFEMA